LVVRQLIVHSPRAPLMPDHQQRRPETYFVALRRGLAENGFEGHKIAIEYQWAEDHYDRLQTMADELSRRDVAVIFAGNYPAAAAVKKATKSIPIVFISGVDPVTSRLVESLNRPNGNATGVYILNGLLEAKRLQMLNQVVPGLGPIGVLVNPDFPGVARQVMDLREASRILGLDVIILNTGRDLTSEFETLAVRHVRGVVVSTDPFLYTYRSKIVELAAHCRLPTIYPFADFVELGGLMSYGTDLSAAYHQCGVYAGRILKGEKPADLPVEQSTKVALILNLKTARTLSIVFSEELQGRADEVIE
jgi:putative ABC transport system substrate-binding protein